MRLYALAEAGDPEAIDVYLCEQDAQRALEDCLRDEPEWCGLLRVEEIEFAGCDGCRGSSMSGYRLSQKSRRPPRRWPNSGTARGASVSKR